MSSFVFVVKNWYSTCEGGLKSQRAHWDELLSTSVGRPRELPLTGDLWDWEQKQPRNQGISCIFSSCSQWLTLQVCMLSCFFSPRSRQMMRTATTAVSVLCVCQTSETHSSCPADICVSATPARTHCVTKPTTVPSAGCVRAAAILLFDSSVLEWCLMSQCSPHQPSGPCFRSEP